MSKPWFDAHLDLSYLALRGRNMLARLGGETGGKQPAALTFPSLRDGDVRWALGTIFILPEAAGDAWGYGSSADVEEAHAAGVRQLELYHRWEQDGHIRIVRTAGDLDAQPGEPLRVLILMEGGDPIRTPDEAAWWFDRGLRVVGMAWSHGTRYAGGDGMRNGTPGLTPRGRDFVAALDALKIVKDFSHLDDASAEQVLEMSDVPVIATHSASRTLQGDNRQRHISDALICAIAQRGGVVGLPLYARFLHTQPGRPTVERTIDHVEHMASVIGRRDALALGSDLDGGFTADDLPLGIDKPGDYERLAEELGRRGWSDIEVDGFRSGNWLRFFREHLPK